MPLSKARRKKLSEEVNSFAVALVRLGQQPPSPRVRLALRRWLWSREPFFDLTLIRATVVVFFVFLYAHLSYWMAVLIRWGFSLDSGQGGASGSDSSAVAQHAEVNPILFAAVMTFGIVTIGASAWAVFVACTVLPYTVAVALWRFIPQTQIKAAVARQTLLIGRIHAAVRSADRVMTRGKRHRAQHITSLFRRLDAVKREIARSHMARGVPILSRRAKHLREHQNVVIAAINRAEEQIDRDPLAAIPSVVELLMKIADRHTRDMSAALLPAEDLEGVEPARNWEPVRMVITALLIGGAAFAVALLDLPDPAVTALIGTAGILGVTLVYGRGANRALGLIDTIRGQ